MMAGSSIGRRGALLGTLLITGALAACGGGAELPPLPARPDGYAWLTPLRLNVADLEVLDRPSGGRVDQPAPLIPANEVARMGRDRIVPSGTSGRARFVVETADLVRSGDTTSVVLRARVEVLDQDRRVAFAEAEARRSLAGGGGSAAARSRVAETLVVRAMEDLNVEFELQLRRNLRDWLMDTTPTAPVTPVDAPGGIERQDLPQP